MSHLAEPYDEQRDRERIDRPQMSQLLVSDLHLTTLIEGLTQYRLQGIRDPWVLSDGTEIDPLHVLVELRAYRKAVTKLVNQ